MVLGFGIQKWSDGSKFVGYFRNDKSNGYGKFIDNENNYLFGNFVDDKTTQFNSFTISDNLDGKSTDIPKGITITSGEYTINVTPTLDVNVFIN